MKTPLNHSRIIFFFLFFIVTETQKTETAIIYKQSKPIIEKIQRNVPKRALTRSAEPNSEILQLKADIESLRKNNFELTTENKRLKTENQKYKAFFEAEASSKDAVTSDEMKILTRFANFSKTTFEIPNSLKTKQAAINKQIAKIKKFHNDSVDIFEQCEPDSHFFRKKSRLYMYDMFCSYITDELLKNTRQSDSNFKTTLKEELRMRTAYNQFEINNAISTIETFMITREKCYDEIPKILERLFKINNYMTRVHPPTDDKSPECPDFMLNVDVMKPLKDNKLISAEEKARPMSDRLKRRFCRLVREKKQ